MMMRLVCRALLLLALVPFATAQRAIIVDAAGGGDFTEIQPAVDAAPVGGLVRVRHGVYPGDVIIRQGIRLIGDRWIRGVEGNILIEGSVKVLDLPTDQSFVGTDLLIRWTASTQYTFVFENCLGNVYLANSIGRLELRNCNYVSTDLCEGPANSVEPGAVVEDSFLISSNSEWSSFAGVSTPMVVTRSKLILVNSDLLNLVLLKQL